MKKLILTAMMCFLVSCRKHEYGEIHIAYERSGVWYRVIGYERGKFYGDDPICVIVDSISPDVVSVTFSGEVYIRGKMIARASAEKVQIVDIKNEKMVDLAGSGISSSDLLKITKNGLYPSGRVEKDLSHE